MERKRREEDRNAGPTDPLRCSQGGCWGDKGLIALHCPVMVSPLPWEGRVTAGKGTLQPRQSLKKVYRRQVSPGIWGNKAFSPEGEQGSTSQHPSPGRHFHSTCYSTISQEDSWSGWHAAHVEKRRKDCVCLYRKTNA